jgi:hypothetical protein
MPKKEVQSANFWTSFCVHFVKNMSKVWLKENIIIKCLIEKGIKYKYTNKMKYELNNI